MWSLRTISIRSESSSFIESASVEEMGSRVIPLVDTWLFYPCFVGDLLGGEALNGGLLKSFSVDEGEVIFCTDYDKFGDSFWL